MNSDDDDFYIKHIDFLTGWFVFDLVILGCEFRVFFSDVYQPMEEFKEWLENIALGASEASFDFDTEGTMVYFTFKRNGGSYFTIKEHDDEMRLIGSVEISGESLIRKLYFPLKEFVEANTKKHKYWEEEYFYQIMQTYMDVSKDELFEILIPLNREKLSLINHFTCYFNNKLLSKRYNGSVENDDELNIQFCHIIIDIVSGKVNNIDEYLEEHDKDDLIADVPENYDTMDYEDRENEVWNIIEAQTNYAGGWNIRGFYSELIEKMFN